LRGRWGVDRGVCFSFFLRWTLLMAVGSS
jgi:hypothetical protein